jgi:hypothetical protein
MIGSTQGNARLSHSMTTNVLDSLANTVDFLSCKILICCCYSSVAVIRLRYYPYIKLLSSTEYLERIPNGAGLGMLSS